MNKKGLFLMGLAAMAFASCSNDDLLSDGSGTTQPTVAGEGEPTYVTFSLNVNGGVKTRLAGEDTGNHVAATEKTEIDSAYLFIFNESSKVLENMFKVKPSNGVTKFTELVTAGDKKIYAIANPSVKMKEEIEALTPKSSNSTLDKFLKITFNATDSASLAALMPSEANMPMSSIDSSNVHKLEPGISATQAAVPDGKNNIKLQLKRMIAKTTLNVTNAEYGQDKAGIVSDSTKYTVRNQSRKTYFVQNKGTGNVKSPTYDLTDADYKATPDSKKENWLFGEHFLWNTKISTKPGTSLYITENTSVSFLKGAAPYIVLHSRYVPDKIVTEVSDGVAAQTVEYTYKDNPGPSEVASMVVSTESRDEALLANGICFKDSLTFAKAVDIAKTYKEDFTASIVNYSKGSYYRINLGQTVSGSTKYGTERNKSYKVNVNSVTGPGWNTPEGADEKATDPVDQKTYVDVTISVADWEEVNQDVDLN